MTATIDSGKILRSLHEQWDKLDQEQSGAGGILRACAMTLVVTAQDDNDAQQIRRTLGVLMHAHPSRAVILRNGAAHPESEGAESAGAESAGAESVDAYVFAECWKPFGSTQQICSEGVQIAAPAARLPEVARLLVPLRVPDLPLVLWCRGPRAFSPGVFDPLYSLADKIIVDSSLASDATAALDFLRALRSRGYRVGDLHWTRLTGWREILASLFQECNLQSADIAAARIAYGGAGPSTCAFYFASWVGQALPAAKVTLDREEGQPGLHSVTLVGGGGTISLAHSGPGCVEVKALGRQYRSSRPLEDEEELMREELKILGPDAVYDRVLG